MPQIRHERADTQKRVRPISAVLKKRSLPALVGRKGALFGCLTVRQSMSDGQTVSSAPAAAVWLTNMGST